MKIRNLITKPATGKLDNQFVGIKIFDNQIEFHYPVTYQLADNDDGLRKDILKILRTVSLAKTKTSDMSSYNTNHSKVYGFPLEAYLWVISDYLVYGRYENHEKMYEHGVRGRISWKKTMQKNPAISQGNIVYTDVISERKSQKDNLLTEIYNFCVKRAIDSIGWLYGLSYDADGVDYEKLFKEKKYINAINTELIHTFDDQKKIRLQNMKDIITGLDNDMINTREIIYGVDSYEYVYERMIDLMFSRVNDIRSFYPNATWELVVDNKSVNSTNLRPDTVLIKQGENGEKPKAYILDAKYYQYGTTFISGDMPETTSIQKQITYGEYVKKVKEGLYSDVYSAFLLPYSKYENRYHDRFNRNLEFIGIGKAKWIDENDMESNRKIAAVLIDTTFLITNWVKQNDDDIDRLIEIIEQNVGEQKGEQSEKK